MIIGWGLILISIWIFLNSFFSSNLFYRISYRFFGNDVYNIANAVIDVVPMLIVPVLCILIGVCLIKGTKPKLPQDENQK